MNFILNLKIIFSLLLVLYDYNKFLNDKMQGNGFAIETIDTSHSDKNFLFVSNPSISSSSVSNTAAHFNHRLHQVSRRLSVLQTSKSISKRKYRIQHSIQTCGVKPLNLDSSKGNQEILEERLLKTQQQINGLKKRIQSLEDKNSELEQQQVRQQERNLKKEKKYILQINRLKQLLDKNEQKDLEFNKAKFQLERYLQKERTKIRKLESEVNSLNKLLKKQSKNEEFIRKLRKKYKDAYFGAKGDAQELAKDIDKNLSIILKNYQNKEKKVDFHKFFDKEDIESDKENTWDPNSMKYSLKTNIPMKESIILKDEIIVFGNQHQMDQIQDFHRIMLMQGLSIQKLLLQNQAII